MKFNSQIHNPFKLMPIIKFTCCFVWCKATIIHDYKCRQVIYTVLNVQLCRNADCKLRNGSNCLGIIPYADDSTFVTKGSCIKGTNQ